MYIYIYIYIYSSVLVLHGNICIRCSVTPKLVLPITGPPGPLMAATLVPLVRGGPGLGLGLVLEARAILH